MIIFNTLSRKKRWILLIITFGIFTVFTSLFIIETKIFHWKSGFLHLFPGDLNATFRRQKPFETHTENSTTKPFSTRHPLDIIYPYPYKFIINEPDKCKHNVPFLILLIISQPQEINVRNAIRQTWGNESLVPGALLIRLFLVGLPADVKLPIQSMLEKESLTYNDIIQQNYLDIYNHLSIKTMMGMEWVTKYCPKASYVIKIDSDMFLNVNYLVYKILRPEGPLKTDYYTGYVVANTGPIRSRSDKWFVPYEMYPNNTYPPYCGGPAYVLSVDLAIKVYKIAQTIKPLNMEDAFMGVCMYYLGIKVTKSPPNVFNGHAIKYERCRFSNLITAHHFSPEKLLEIWPDFMKAKDTCERQSWINLLWAWLQIDLWAPF
ncbi:beta-1,3-galactosyltransferase 2-like [Latimeria chalumnae]|uniref:beta-1,3-galactosyltransferase 2-like n=1 Tax=Latimeria chalumnae TaxID=7897 RepID=UPI00313B5854